MTDQTASNATICAQCGLCIADINGAWLDDMIGAAECVNGHPHTPIRGVCEICWHICENELPGEVPALTTVVLFEANADTVVIARAGKAWNLGPVTPYLVGGFVSDASTWCGGEWEPNEPGGQTPTHVHDLAAVAFWRQGKAALLGPIGYPASSYAGPL